MAHVVICYGVPSVSGDLEMPDWKFLGELFPGRNFIRSLHRAAGPIDVLLSTTYLSLYPKEIDEIGNLRVYRSGLNPERTLVAGCHPKLPIGNNGSPSDRGQLNRNVRALTDASPATTAGVARR